MGDQQLLGLALAHARNFSEAIRSAVQGSPFGGYDRDRFALALWQMSIEDFGSIVHLLKVRSIFSARALVRPQFEAMLRGSWMRWVCGEGTIDEIAAYRAEFPGLDELVTQLDLSPALVNIGGERLQFGILHTRLVRVLHDATHRGTDAVARILIANGGGESHVDEAEIGMLWVSGYVASVAGLQILDTTGRRRNDSLDRACLTYLDAIKKIDAGTRTGRTHT
jgi:hypothetical protein